MTKGLKFFLIIFAISLPFWWGVNFLQEKLENFLLWGKTALNPELLTAQIVLEKNLEKSKPIRNRQIDNPEIAATAAISVFIEPGQNTEKILFEKNKDKKLPIASLAKLMTANVVLENYDIEQEEMERSLFLLLIESNNDAAVNLAKIINKESFVELMNLKAEKRGMNKTYFANPTGLDPLSPEELINYSTANDLVKLAKYITLERPLIWEISTIKEFEKIKNTNQLLGEVPGIIGGKTGETALAGKCLILVVEAPENKGFLVNVILNSENHFEEMKKLITWVKDAYRW